MYTNMLLLKSIFSALVKIQSSLDGRYVYSLSKCASSPPCNYTSVEVMSSLHYSNHSSSNSMDL